MKLFDRTGPTKWILVLLLVFLGLGSVVYNQYLINRILEQERASVQLWAKALEFNALPIHQESSRLLLNVIDQLESQKAIPDSLIQKLEEVEGLRSTQNFVTDELILDNRGSFKLPAVLVDDNDRPLEYLLLDEKGEPVVEYSFRNIRSTKVETEEKRLAYVQKLKNMNPPIPITVGDGEEALRQYVYYGESTVVQILRYVPAIQIVVIMLLFFIGYTSLVSITRMEQSNLWVGMAKEAAHQLGTPISSLLGWIHLFRDDLPEQSEQHSLLNEIEKDVYRLKGVAERFGKIGSKPELKPLEIAPVLDEAIKYMERRLPKIAGEVSIKTDLQATGLVKLNPELLQWAVENLMKNAMDALQMTQESSNKGITVRSYTASNGMVLEIADTGIGMDAATKKNIFRPGYSTKKRGWGLGLNLTKRIVEEYHGGELTVTKSELGVGTTMQIRLKLV
ncbi:HAMP domain-containing histidine kinase [Bacteroidota bacterium]|jgi:signal transduction histidine kinase|nr:HAMP domain-containing histidine kinase [Balneolaceae bacterium]MDC3136271.1 HAMP domain-containing histidine kinase [Bacteroidota bacterium]PDH57253.1 MAG: two-component sensor histidine kinase [Rhodothermaeota bacterium MED-G12]|tara:strand:- start:4630 stop:5979 length:1350 start_codon:yes stop_codon:yes gene_type:complete